MAQTMRVQPFATLLRRILDEFASRGSIFGIPHSLFYLPREDPPYAGAKLFGHHLATPIGPAAGPHTQLAQNIVCAWLCGGRFIELKTVQVLDELEIPRPCIDLEDEGYNVEWSQELKLDQSTCEYARAWVLIHLLHRLLGLEGKVPLGTIFNMSVGYNLEGIRSGPMTRFMDRLADASAELSDIQATLQQQFPSFAGLDIPVRIVHSATLSTMHGCPPDEIERIARYLLEERGLHTMVKLNPTLLGQEAVLHILHDQLGFREIHVPDEVFERDLQYGQAVELIGRLLQVAAGCGLTFGVKLSNTLAVANHKGVLPGSEMYMSGRALYPITMHLFQRLAQEFGGRLPVSYSAGADALNVTTLLSCGALPVTAASDLLKPGGYARLGQYLENLGAEMRRRGAADLDDLARDRLMNLETAAAEALQDPRYRKAYHPYSLPRVDSALERLDCIAAPCVARCPLLQEVPEYAWLIAQGEYDRALEVILSRNPLPAVTGYVCTHLCQTRCTRSDYDQPVAIRALKRFAVEHGMVQVPRVEPGAHKVAVVGGGPSGLAAAFFLALSGIQTTIFEAGERAGGMLTLAPSFRLPAHVVKADVDRIAGLGVQIELNHPVLGPPEELLQQGFDAVYLACGFPLDARLEVEGIEGDGVYGALDFLSRVAQGNAPLLGSQVAVVGGGNTAMDAARTAARLSCRPATVLYRRSRAEMPAEPEEVGELLAEGNRLEELVSPRRVIREAGRVSGLECLRNRLGEPGADGRRQPVPLEGSAFIVPADTLIVAIGQQPVIAFLGGSTISLRPDGSIAADPQTGRAGPEGVYAGGDAVRGPATIVAACADGRRAAEAILQQFGLPFCTVRGRPASLSPAEIARVKRARARKETQHLPETLPLERRDGFDLVEQTLEEEAARAEARRCLQCSTLCDRCVEVCPNRANLTYMVEPQHLWLPRLSCRLGHLTAVGKEEFRVRQARQVLHLADLCNECGNCATFCVHQGKPYLDKPRLYLQESDFVRESDNAFFVRGNTVRRREGGRESLLSLHGDGFSYETAQVEILFSPGSDVLEMTLRQPFEGVLSLVEAAEMAVLLQGVTRSLPFLFGQG